MLSLEEGILDDSEIYFFQPSEFARNNLFWLQHIGVFHCDERYSATHPFWESILIIFIDKGQLETWFNQEHFTAGSGDVVLLDCRYPHRYMAKNTVQFHYFHFSGHSSSHYCALVYELYGSALLKGVYTELQKNIFNNMLRYVRSQINRDNEHRISVYIHLILCDLIESRKSTMIAGEDYVSHAISFMQDHLTQKITVANMASAVGLSKFYFSRMFSEKTGVTPHHYFNNMRIQESKRLLLMTNQSVESIAAACGFENASNYIRLFRACTGMTPSAFRKIPF